MLEVPWSRATPSGDASPTQTPLPLSSVLGKVAKILDVMATSGGRIGLSELARGAGLSKATTYRLCQDLTRWGVVERTGDSFRLGSKLFELGQRVPTRRFLRDAALPFLEDLFVATRQTIHLAVLEGDHVLYVEKLDGRHSVPPPSEVAGRVPLHCTATGKCLLAFSSPDLVARTFSRGLKAQTASSITDPVLLADELKRVRTEGIALERGEFVDGFASVAAPIFGLGEILVGALAVTSSIDRLQPDAVIPLVRDAASGASWKLGSRNHVRH